VAGVLVALATIGAGLAFPWQRVHRRAQLVPPMLFVVAVLLLAATLLLLYLSWRILKRMFGRRKPAQ
jgi:multisubunit Na+/H+ antiporter MnhB subunit